MQHCPICAQGMPLKVADWTFYCPACDYWSADLKYDIASESDEIFDFDQEGGEVISFLDAIRVRNFNIILDRVSGLTEGRPLRILDVGCATGLFIRIAAARGHVLLGLEPNPKMAATAQKKGLDVVNGYFPEALAEGDAFDLIIFNDVFEHIPELTGIIDGALSRLNEGGLLVINLPSSRGLLFHMGKLLYGMGVEKLWDRLWQKMFYTPHLHYFNEASLDKLLLGRGMKLRSTPIELSAVSVSGLWARISVDASASFVKRAVMYVAALAVYPFMHFFPKDTFVAFYGRK